MLYEAPKINVDRESLLVGIELVLSEKDTTRIILADSDNQFVYEKNC